MKSIFILLIYFAAGTWTGLQAVDTSLEPPTSWKYPPEMPGARVETYRQVGEVKLNAYIFEPKGHTAADRRPAVVFFFGGGWNGGTPGQFLPQALYLAERGMVAIPVDYRVKSRHQVFPQDCLRDAKAAIRWVRANADRLGIDSERIVASGGSAGGHLAAAVALVPGFEDGDHLSVNSMPNALVLYNPAVVLSAVEGRPDLLAEEKLKDIRERMNGRPQEIEPYHFVRSGLPPSLILQGKDDQAVPFPTVELFQKAMVAAGNQCTLKSYEGQPHGFFNPGRGEGKPRAEATRHFHLTMAEADSFLTSLGYLPPKSILESFDAGFDPGHFTTPIPNKNTEVRNGALWTHGNSGGKYPPMVYLPVAGKDITISFRYRHLGEGGWLWFFVDGDDGFGSIDHMLRVKLLRQGVQLEVDSHSLDAGHPMRQKSDRPADPVSKAYRLNEFLPLHNVDLSSKQWHDVKLVFQGETVTISVDGLVWTETLSRPAFDSAKRKLLWMQNGGEEGIELDDIRVDPTQ
ncbi:MAG: alpha/beta hydrolase [Verrucomicrobiales bacterium]